MHSLPKRELETLIKMEGEGKLTADDIYKRVALRRLQSQDSYVSSAIGFLAMGAVCVGLAGSVVTPVFVLLWGYSWVKSYKGRTESIRRITQGHFADYLEAEDLLDYEQDKAIATVQETAKTAAVAAIETMEAASVPTAPNQGLKIVDLPRAMGQSLHPTIISAKPRIGKGMVIQSAWRWAKKLHPGITVWVIDPKPHKTERAYWEGVDRYWGEMIEDFPQNDEAIALQLTEFIHEWRAQGDRPTLLIIDELVKLEAVLPKWYKDFLISTMKVEASSGETDQRFLWVIAQSPQVRDLGLTGGSRAVFDFLTLQRADSIDHAERVKASIGAIKSIPTAEEFASVPSGVAFWHSRVNRWGGVPLLDVPQSAKTA